VDAVAAGNLTHQEAGDLSGLIGNCVRTIETVELEQRVEKLEDAAKEARQ
jgi:hypothetical protein